MVSVFTAITVNLDPAGLDIGLINKYYDLSGAGDSLAHSHYEKLEKKASACVKCGTAIHVVRSMWIRFQEWRLLRHISINNLKRRIKL